MSSFLSWRFDSPEWSGYQESQGGLQIGSRGRIAMLGGNASIRQSIRLLLATTPGERVMLPEYGCNLSQLVFANNDATTAGLAIHYISQALKRWEPRIDLLHVNAFASEEKENHLRIELEYRSMNSREADRMTYLFDLQGKED